MKFMKILVALPVLLFLAGAAYAQIPLFGFPNLQPYYPGAISAPYYPQAYYPLPYGQAYGYYGQETYVPAPFGVSNNSGVIDNLTRQVQQLTDQVRLLQGELSAAQAQQAQAPPAAASAPPPARPAMPVVLILRDGRRIEAQGYAVTGQKLWILGADGCSQQVPLSSLDIEATEKENLSRGGFNIPKPRR